MRKIVLFVKECMAEPWFHLIFLVVMIGSLWFSLLFLTVEKTALAYLHHHFATKLPPKTIRITPKPAKTLSLFGLQLKRPVGSFIDDKVLRKIQNLPGVARVYPFLSSQVPMQVQISLFGIGYQSDVVAIGVPWEFIQSEVPPPYRARFRKWKEGESIGALLPLALLDMYNQTLATPNQLPTITEDFAKGQKLRLVFGKSSLKTVGTPIVIEGELVGFSRKIGEIALILPFSVVQHYNRLFGYTNPEYSYVLIEAENHESVPSLIKAIQKLGLVVASESTLSEEIVSLKKALHLVFRWLQGLVWGLCAIAIGLAAFLAGLRRQRYYHLLRILGESRVFLFGMIGIKYGILVWGAFSLATVSFESLVRHLPFSFPGLPLEIAKKPDMVFFYVAVAIALFPSFSLLSTRPGNKL
ncbi:MAG: hypothetical protein N2314_05410 [Brevinematales bacterium]|nr:hypothetical protein [Brevinematales bacterium]